MALPQLHTATQALARYTFRQGTNENYLRQAKCFMDFFVNITTFSSSSQLSLQFVIT